KIKEAELRQGYDFPRRTKKLLWQTMDGDWPEGMGAAYAWEGESGLSPRLKRILPHDVRIIHDARNGHPPFQMGEDYSRKLIMFAFRTEPEAKTKELLEKGKHQVRFECDSLRTYWAPAKVWYAEITPTARAAAADIANQISGKDVRHGR